MDSLILISILSLSAVAAQPVPEGQGQNVVPGVFISNEMLKDLQDKTDPSLKTTQNISGSDVAAANLNEALRNYNGQQLKVNQGYSSPLENQPPIISNQPQQPAVTQVISSQQVPATQPAVVIAQTPVKNLQPQTIYVSQQPTNTQQQMLVGQQPITSQQPLVITQQPSQQLLVSQQSTGSQQPIVIAAQQPNAIPNQQPILVNQQPNNQQPILVTQAVQQPSLSNQQTIFGQPQNPQTYVLQNGQILTSSGQQPSLVAANPSNGNQVTLVTTPNQNQNSVYTLVPVNGQNTLTSSNLGNGNTYLVPVQNVQQLPGNQMYTLGAGK